MMISRNAIYNTLVNKHPGIFARYHRIHDGLTGMPRILSWLYLLWLNFAYYILQCRFLGRIPQMEIYEKKRLNCVKSESEAYLQSHPELSVDLFVERLSQYDIISFDVFDTLIFRPLSLPADVFYLIGQELEVVIEQKLCYQNPFMLAVWKKLKERSKKMIIVSDMYLSEKCIWRI